MSNSSTTTASEPSTQQQYERTTAIGQMVKALDDAEFLIRVELDAYDDHQRECDEIEEALARALFEFGSYDLATDSMRLEIDGAVVASRSLSRLQEEGFGKIVEDVRHREFGGRLEEWEHSLGVDVDGHVRTRWYPDSGITEVTVLAQHATPAAAMTLATAVVAAIPAF
jgi:hypothetical protein